MCAGPWIEYSRGPYSHATQRFFAAGGFAPQETFEMIWIHFLIVMWGRRGQLLTSLAEARCSYSFCNPQRRPHHIPPIKNSLTLNASSAKVKTLLSDFAQRGSTCGPRRDGLELKELFGGQRLIRTPVRRVHVPSSLSSPSLPRGHLRSEQRQSGDGGCMCRAQEQGEQSTSVRSGTGLPASLDADSHSVQGNCEEQARG